VCASTALAASAWRHLQTPCDLYNTRTRRPGQLKAAFGHYDQWQLMPVADEFYIVLWRIEPFAEFV